MKKSFLMLAAISVTFLAGCGEHKNPLINDKTIAYLKTKNAKELKLENIRQEWNRDYGTTTKNEVSMADCGSYYAGYSGDKSKLKNECQTWSKNEFENLQKDPSTPYQATIDDFRDPALWKIIIQQKQQ